MDSIHNQVSTPQNDDSTTGMATKADQKLNVNPSQIQDDPTTIIATTAAQNLLTLLYMQWIYAGSYRIDSKMKAGTKIFILPIHPNSCNKYVSYINRMFNAWTGDLLLRTRTVSTTAFGGMLRIAKLPPNLTRAQIELMDVASLTSYDNVELNPTHADWRHWEFTDERNILYHYNDNFDENDRDSFGGWIVLFMESALVKSSDGSDQIELVVETRGNFQWRQVNPNFSYNQSVITSKFQQQAVLGINTQPFTDFHEISNQATIKYLNTSVTQLHSGFFLCRPAGLKDEVWSYPGGSTTQRMIDWKNAVKAGTLIPLASGECSNSRPSGVTTYSIIKLKNTVGTTPATFWASQFGTGYQYVSPNATTPIGQMSETFMTADHIGFSDAGNVDAEDEAAVFPSPATTKPYDYRVIEDGETPLANSTVSSMSVGESIVVFHDPYYSALSIQYQGLTTSIDDPQFPFPKLTDSESHIFMAYNARTGISYGYWRLCPNGMFTTEGTPEDITIPNVDPINLIYNSTISMNEPLPESSRRVQDFLHALSISTRKYDDLITRNLTTFAKQQLIDRSIINKYTRPSDKTQLEKFLKLTY